MFTCVSSVVTLVMLVITLTTLLMLTRDGQAKLRTIEDVACEDEYVDCSARAEQCCSDQVETVLDMLTHCRETCRQHFSDR